MYVHIVNVVFQTWDEGVLFKLAIFCHLFAFGIHTSSTWTGCVLNNKEQERKALGFLKSFFFFQNEILILLIRK